MGSAHPDGAADPPEGEHQPGKQVFSEEQFRVLGQHTPILAAEAPARTRTTSLQHLPQRLPGVTPAAVPERMR